MKPKSRTTLFLTELIIVICFFSITAAICTQIFAKARLVSIHTSDMNQAILHVESVAEAFRSVDGDFDALSLLFPEAHTAGKEELKQGIRSTNGENFGSGYMEIFYDAEWKSCDKITAVYQLIVNTTDEGSIRTAQISVTKLLADEVLYTMDVQKHPRKEAEL